MSEKPRIQARVTLLTPQEGGRSKPSFDFQQYRPHIVIGNPSQREALVSSDGHSLVEEYLGIRFTGNGNELTLGEEFAVELELAYFPDVDYSGLRAGATFTIREGGTVVGFGEVERGPWEAA